MKGKEARNSCLLSIKVAFLQSFVIEDYFIAVMILDIFFQ